MQELHYKMVILDSILVHINVLISVNKFFNSLIIFIFTLAPFWRPWYVNGMTGTKNIILIIDDSIYGSKVV